MRDLGEITGCWTLTCERRTRHGAAALWRAISEADRVAAWWGSPARIDPRVGGSWYVDFGPDRGALDGVIVRLEPERRLALVWGRSVVEWTIEPEADGCRYTFVHHGQEPGLAPSEAGLAAGWHAFLESIERLLDGATVDAAADRRRHAELEELYRPKILAVLAGAAGA